MESFILRAAADGLIPPLKPEEFKEHMDEDRARHLLKIMGGSVSRIHPFLPQELQSLQCWCNIDINAYKGTDFLQVFPVHPLDPTLDPWEHPCSIEVSSKAVKEKCHHHIGFLRYPDDGFTFLEIEDPMNVSPMILPDVYCEMDALYEGVVCFYKNDEFEFEVPEGCSPIEYKFNQRGYVTMTGRYIGKHNGTYIHPCPDIAELYMDDRI